MSELTTRTLPLAGPRGPVRLRLSRVGKRYRRRTVFEGVDLTVHGGEVAAIVGANGCGKSTLLRICAGLTRPSWRAPSPCSASARCRCWPTPPGWSPS